MLILTAIPDLLLPVVLPFFSPLPQLSSQWRALNPNTLSDRSTHTYTHSRRKGWERDNRETTAVSYRKCITA